MLTIAKSKNICTICSKVYTHASSLSRHKNKCKGVKVEVEVEVEVKETVSNVEERLTNIEQKLEQILLLLSKSEPIIKNIIKEDVIPVVIQEVKIIKKIKKVKKEVIVPVIIIEEEEEEIPLILQLPIIEQKKLFDPYNTNVEKLISNIQRENKTLEQYILNLPEYALSFIPIDDLLEIILDKFEDDHIYAGNLKVSHKHCFYSKNKNEWRRDSRASDYVDNLQELLKSKYLNIAKSLYKNISKFDRAYNDKIISEDNNEDFHQVLQNLVKICNKSSLYYTVQNHISKRHNFMNLESYVDNKQDLLEYNDAVSSQDDMGVFETLFSDFRDNKIKILEKIREFGV